MLDKETYPNAKVVNLAQKMIAVKVNPEINKDNQALAMKYQLEGTPTILFLNAKGKKLHSIVGFVPPKQFADEMEKALKLAKK
jgi:thioredoxin-related protein